jgi:hypothetical protein
MNRNVSINGRVVATTHTTGTGQVMTTHLPMHCRFRWCVIHHPMPGVWDEWPTHWRDDRRIMERICPCGVGHPAAEEYLFHSTAALVHDCCGRHACIPDLNNLQAAKEPMGQYLDGEVVEDKVIKEIGR